MSATEADIRTSVLRPHTGMAIILAARTYMKVLQVILEAMQNSLDAGAKNVWVNINWKKRTITIRDDGNGVDRETFDRALANIGKSIKPKGKLGRWGYGLVAPLEKCEYFTFTSQPKHTSTSRPPYLRWRFDTNEIAGSSEEIHLQPEEVDMTFSRSKNRKSNMVNWRTSVELFGVIDDRRITHVDDNELVETALEEFRGKMVKLGTQLHINVVPVTGEAYSRTVVAEPYSGEKLPEVEKREGNGKTTFQVFLARRTGNKYAGKLSFGQTGDAFRVPSRKFVQSAQGLLEPELAKALTSGVFEGEIVSNLLKLQANRTSFADDDDLFIFVAQLEEWYFEIGRAHFEAACDVAESERFNRTAEQALNQLQKMLDDPGMKDLADLVKTFPPNPQGVGVPVGGDTGDAEAEVAGDTKTQTTKKPVKSGGGGGGGNGGSNGVGNGGGSSGNGGTTGEMDVDEEVFVPDPNGKSRRTVKVKNFGLRFGETDDIQDPWTLDVAVGILWINTSHSLYSQCSDARNADRVIQKYQQFVAVQALSLHALPEEWRESASEVQDLELRAHVSMLTQ